MKFYTLVTEAHESARLHKPVRQILQNGKEKWYGGIPVKSGTRTTLRKTLRTPFYIRWCSLLTYTRNVLQIMTSCKSGISELWKQHALWYCKCQCIPKHGKGERDYPTEVSQDMHLQKSHEKTDRRHCHPDDAMWNRIWKVLLSAGVRINTQNILVIIYTGSLRFAKAGTTDNSKTTQRAVTYRSLWHYGVYLGIHHFQKELYYQNRYMVSKHICKNTFI